MNAQFLYVVCQRGAEGALKQELSHQHPELRLSYSRPGFATFKLPAETVWPADAELRSVFARTHGLSLGRVQNATAERLADELWKLAGELPVDHLHVWQRDAGVPGERGFEPHLTTLAAEVGEIIASRMPAQPGRPQRLPVNLVAKAGHRILDCVLVEPDEWWVGYHQATTMPSRWPGGTPKIKLPDEAVSRAWLKMTEALLWSRLPVAPGDRCVEIGSAPGGSCQALLDRGLLVTGIDPAKMDDAVLAHPNFTHWRTRSADLKRREFRGMRWLAADPNVAPEQTLETVEQIVTHQQVNIRGLLMTVKLSEWALAEKIPEYLARVRSWGYKYVNARQLAFNRQEICVAAMRSRSLRRLPARSERAERLPARQPEIEDLDLS